MSTLKKSELFGAIWTIIINGIIVLLLILFGLSMNPPVVPDPGIEISFGDGMVGAPAPEQSVSEPQPQTQVATSVPQPQPQSAPEVITQEDPSIAIEAERKRREEREYQEQMRLEQQRIEQEQAREAARQAAEAKAAADRAAKAAKANAMAAGAFGGGGNSAAGDGVGGGGKGNVPGNPLGKGSAGGNSWSLAGRDLSSKFYKPSYVGDQEGRIVVSITVDRSGSVISAEIKRGTTITDEGLREECKAAARKLRFSSDIKAVGNAIGEIIYRFSQQ